MNTFATSKFKEQPKVSTDPSVAQPPLGIHLLESTGVTVEDITLRNFPAGVLRPQLCNKVRLSQQPLMYEGSIVITGRIP